MFSMCVSSGCAVIDLCTQRTNVNYMYTVLVCVKVT